MFCLPFCMIFTFGRAGKPPRLGSRVQVKRNQRSPRQQAASRSIRSNDFRLAGLRRGRSDGVECKGR